MLSPQDRQKQKELQAELGEVSAFFDSPVGLIALTVPEQPAEVFWKFHRDSQNDQLDRTGVAAAFAKQFVVYPDSNVVAGALRSYPALAIRLSRACRRLLGDEITAGVEFDEETYPTEAEKLEELRREHGEVVWYMVPDVGLIVLAASKSPATYRQFFNAVSNGAEETSAEETYTTFALDLVAYPKRETVAEVLKRLPCLAKKFCQSGDRLFGGGFEELGKI